MVEHKGSACDDFGWDGHKCWAFLNVLASEGH
jgi:hypothetical protein